MECIFARELNLNSTKLSVPTVEAKHLKALRIKDNERILITNGDGLSAVATIKRIDKNDYFAYIEELLPNYGELDYSLALAIGIIDSPTRFEFAIEKSIELGVSEIYPLILDYSQCKKINQERLTSKAISALKQCKRSRLPIIHNPQTLANLFTKISNCIEENQIILADAGGLKASKFFLDN